jgi:hypothetical protein
MGLHEHALGGLSVQQVSHMLRTSAGLLLSAMPAATKPAHHSINIHTV